MTGADVLEAERRWGRNSSGWMQAALELALEIRAAVPIAGTTATTEECEARSELIAAARREVGDNDGARAWYTLETEAQPGEEAPPFGGVWSSSVLAAVLSIAMWRPELDGRHVIACKPDEGCRRHHELSRRRALELRREEQDATSVYLF